MSEQVKMNYETVEETTEETKEGVLSKIGGFTKRNGKKIATGVAVIAGLGVAYYLGKNSNITFPAEIVGDVSDTITDVADEVTNL